MPIQANFPILSKATETLEKTRKFTMKLLKVLLYDTYESVLHRLRLSFLICDQIRENLISMFKIAHDVLMELITAPPNRHGHAFKIHYQ